MKRQFKRVTLVLLSAFVITSCTNIRQSMREPNSRVDFTAKDFTFSEQVSGEAKTVKVLGIDWKRLFNKKEGEVESGMPVNFSLASIPVIGTLIPGDKTTNYALYNMMQANPGYDVIFYPQFEKTEKRPILIPLIRITKVKAKARLAKIKTN